MQLIGAVVKFLVLTFLLNCVVINLNVTKCAYRFHFHRFRFHQQKTRKRPLTIFKLLWVCSLPSPTLYHFEETKTFIYCYYFTYLFVCVYSSSSFGWRYGMNGMVIQVHAVNLIDIRLGERWQPISNQSWVTGSPTTNKADCHWWVPKSRLTCWVSNFTITIRWSTGGSPVSHIKVEASR